MLQDCQVKVRPAHALMRQAAGKSAYEEPARNEMTALWAGWPERDVPAAAFAQRMHLAREARRQQERVSQAAIQRAIVWSTVVSVLAIVISVGSLFLWHSRADDAGIGRIYARMSPAVANIQVRSAGVTGSGVVFDTSGHVLTNYHVISEAQADEDIVVRLPELGQVSSVLLGYDIATDLAVLQVDAPPECLTAAKFGDSSRVKVGDLAVAIGSPFGLFNTLTVGHISATSRRLTGSDPYAADVENTLQTDAAINPGNSGGPLFNTDGHVIGINTRIESPTRGSVGLGFAIPSNTALSVAHAIITHGYVQRPFLGVNGRTVQAEIGHGRDSRRETGLLVQEIHPGSPAAQINLRAAGRRTPASRSDTGDGDIILSVDGQAVESQSDLNRLVGQGSIGEIISLEILRNGHRVTLDAKLAERPPTSPGGMLVRSAGRQ